MLNNSLRSSRNESLAGDRLPPQNLDAERSLLGGLLLSKDAFHHVLGLLPEDFYRDSHARIFELMNVLHDKHEPIDLLTLSNSLAAQGILEQVGGRSYLVELTESVPTTANIEYYARIVSEKSTLRKLIAASANLASRAYEGSEDVQDLITVAEKEIFEIHQGNMQQRLVPLNAVLTDSVERLGILFNSKGAVTGLETGFTDLDRLTSGFQSKNLIIIAARPGMGKTSFVLNIALHAALTHNKSVAFFSLEMGKEELVTRLICSEARINMTDLRNGTVPAQNWTHLTQAASHLSSAPIYFDDQGVMDIRYITGKCRRQKADGNLDVVVVDYLQLMTGSSRSERREQEIAEISRGLKALAKELNVPVIALSQLNRAVEGRNDKRPMMADLRESGAIEQDADVIGFIYRPELYAKDEAERREQHNKAELIIAKHRSGATGTIKLTFISEYTKFENFADESPQGGYESAL